MTERQRNMIEQERNMAKQIKEFLDKGIPKADIAKATDFSLEYIDSLLEKYSPKTPEKDQDSDIQSQLNFLKQQVQILQNKLEFENVQLKQQLNTIQKKQIWQKTMNQFKHNKLFSNGSINLILYLLGFRILQNKKKI